MSNGRVRKIRPEMADFGRVPGKYLHLLQLITGGASLTSAASQAGLSARQARRLAAQPWFQARVREGREQAFDLTLSRLALNATIAVGVLGRLAVDESVSAPARIRAATALLMVTERWRAGSDLLERLARLEALVGTDATREMEGT